MSFKSLLKEKIEREKYVSYESLVSFSLAEGYRISNMERRCRELCNEFPIEAVEKKSKRGSYYVAAYKWNGFYPTKDREPFMVYPKILDTIFSSKKIERDNFPAPFPVKKEQQDRLI